MTISGHRWNLECKCKPCCKDVKVQLDRFIFTKLCHNSLTPTTSQMRQFGQLPGQVVCTRRGSASRISCCTDVSKTDLRLIRTCAKNHHEKISLNCSFRGFQVFTFHKKCRHKSTKRFLGVRNTSHKRCFKHAQCVSIAGFRCSLHAF